MLPNATETKIFVTANARALRHFIEMRGDAAADVEISRLAVAVCKLMQKEAPNLFGDYASTISPMVDRRSLRSFARFESPGFRSVRVWHRECGFDLPIIR